MKTKGHFVITVIIVSMLFLCLNIQTGASSIPGEISYNSYDVTKWNCGINSRDDIGAVINSIISNIKKEQTNKNLNGGGKPGAIIYIPSGDYHLKTQVLIDVSFIKIQGAGHGFTSSSIRYNSNVNNWHEIWPGGSHIIVDIPTSAEKSIKDGAAFRISRTGEPRLSGIEFENLCIDGGHFVDYTNTASNPENTYTNRKTGILIETANDSFCIRNMGMIYLEHGIISHSSDAMNISDNFIAECGNAIELLDSGQSSKVTDNLIGAGYIGHSIFAENFNNLLVSGNNVFPRGDSSVRFKNVSHSTITGNHLHSFYPGIIVLEDTCNDNLISSNNIFREHEPWGPMQRYNNGKDDLYGIIQINGNRNSVLCNKITIELAPEDVIPSAVAVTAIHMITGTENLISTNHITGHTPTGKKLQVTSVLFRNGVIGNTVLDSGKNNETSFDKTKNVFRATP